MMPHQEALERYALPSSEERLAMYGLAHRLLPEAGYLPVGMDHFALDGDELVEASRAARLHRNFMGYTTRPGLDQIGLGVSSISDLGASYAQHTKDLGAYRASLEGGRLPFERALLLGRDDEVRRAVIMSLLCNFQADLDEIGRRFDLDWRGAFDDDLERLGPLEADGLLVRPGEGGLLRVTPLGRPFVRIACMAFDRYLEEGGARYSRTL
jgi:oxygen-independent coproporphyrinogen-3 oxidase